MSLIESEIAITNVIHDIDTSHFLIEFRVKPLSGDQRVVRVPRELSARPSLIVQKLLQAGANLPMKSGDALALVKSLILQAPAKIRKGTTKTGWVNDSPTFIFPDESIGPESIVYLGNTNRYEQKGRLKDWKHGLTEVTASSSYALFAAALGFAGCLITPCKQTEGFVFHLTGESSAGKGVAELLALSVSGRAERFGFVTHDTTDRGIEEAAAAANHLLLVIDELGRMEGTPAARRKKLSNLGYGLAGGQGRTRSNAVAFGPLANLRYQIVGLSSGEIPLEGEDSVHPRQAGERVRFIEIAVPPKEEGGIFDRLAEKNRLEEAARLAAQVDEVVSANFGRPIRRFLKFFTSDYEANSRRAQALVNEFVSKAKAVGDERLARKFGLVFAAAVLASEFKIVPWTKSHAFSSIVRLFRNARRVIDPELSKKDLLRRLRKMATRSDIFPEAPKGKTFDVKEAKGVLGVRRKIAGEPIVAILSQKYPSLVRPPWHAEKVLIKLRDEGILASGKTTKHNVRQLQVPGLIKDIDRPQFLPVRAQTLDPTG